MRYAHHAKSALHGAVDRVSVTHFGTTTTTTTKTVEQEKWCRRRGSNPYGPFGPQDFKSCAYASFATPATGFSKR